MTFPQFLKSERPVNSPILRAIKLTAQGSWHEAHDIVDRSQDELSMWLHALLHKIEGDTFNAGYWYRRAGKENSHLEVMEELENIYQEFSMSR